jgi:hypothetical protein
MSTSPHADPTLAQEALHRVGNLLFMQRERLRFRQCDRCIGDSARICASSASC